MFDQVCRLSGEVHLVAEVADKDLLQRASADLVRPLAGPASKRGFSLPMQDWLVGPLRNLAEHGAGQAGRWELLASFIPRARGARLVGERDPRRPTVLSRLAAPLPGHKLRGGPCNCDRRYKGARTS